MKKYSINDFRLATPEEAQARAWGGHGILSGSPRGISTYVVFKYLKSHFGLPNTPFESADGPPRVTWEYILKGPRRYLAIYVWKPDNWGNWGIGIRLPGSIKDYGNLSYEEITKYDDEARADANILIDDIIKYAKSARIPITKNNYQIIENTFQINYSYGEYFYQSLEKPFDRSSDPLYSQSLMKSGFLEDTAMAGASVMSFVLCVEALFNIIFEIYLKKEISNDEILRQHTFRLPLTDKWLLFASLCTCFSKPLNRKSRGYQSLKRLIDIRNHWAHANIREEMRTYIIEEDELAFATKRSPIQKDIQPSISSVGYNWINRVKKDVKTIKLEILNAFKRNEKTKFSKALEQSHLWLTNQGILIVD